MEVPREAPSPKMNEVAVPATVGLPSEPDGPNGEIGGAATGAEEAVAVEEAAAASAPPAGVSIRPAANYEGAYRTAVDATSSSLAALEEKLGVPLPLLQSRHGRAGYDAFMSGVHAPSVSQRSLVDSQPTASQPATKLAGAKENLKDVQDNFDKLMVSLRGALNRLSPMNDAAENPLPSTSPVEASTHGCKEHAPPPNANAGESSVALVTTQGTARAVPNNGEAATVRQKETDGYISASVRMPAGCSHVVNLTIYPFSSSPASSSSSNNTATNGHSRPRPSAEITSSVKSKLPKPSLGFCEY
eukprot:GHVT01102266.1.p1 GENE.GHVT01102266.1~~GHVT01102266.1.p1  ORF type:complete len:302 (-),score=59.22 GHVT01102266.1:2322-3227(-)